MKLEGKQVAILLERGFEDLEFWVPVMRLREEGTQVTIVSPEPQHTYTGKHGLTATSDIAAHEVDTTALDAVVVPGGWAPDKLRRDEGVKTLVRSMYDDGKLIGLICHAGLVGISAGIVDGHRATGSTGIKDDLINAGAIWVDEAAFRDGNIVWGRVVKDIPAFCRTLVKALTEEEVPATA